MFDPFKLPETNLLAQIMLELNFTGEHILHRPTLEQFDLG